MIYGVWLKRTLGIVGSEDYVPEEVTCFGSIVVRQVLGMPEVPALNFLHSVGYTPRIWMVDGCEVIGNSSYYKYAEKVVYLDIDSGVVKRAWRR